MTPRSPRALYVGWQGRGNTGDDAMFSAISGHLAPARLLSLPVYAPELAAAVASRRLAGVRHAPVVLGGGTLAGRSVWRRVLTRKAFPLVGRSDRFMLGTGVEDPAFQGRHSYSDGGKELGRWRRVLEPFRRVTVRGPRSQELLAEAGIEARVVGDPALLLGPRPGEVTRQEGTVGVTLGFGDDLWGHDQQRVTAAVSGASRHLRAEGWRVRLLALNPEDAAGHARLAGDGVEVECTPDADAYLSAVAGCQVVIAQRLHAMVLSAAAGTPFVALDYQPKCTDFLASVGWRERSVRTDEVTAGAVAGQVEALADEWDGASTGLATAVDGLRSSLREELAAVRSAVAA